jgi:hypothetical protein
MARPPRPENANNPLRVLRTLLGRENPMPQHQLSRMTEIPVDTIRSLEVGRMTFSKAIQRKITAETGGVWDDDRKCWMTGPLCFEKLEPFTRQHFEFYRSIIISEPGMEFQELAPNCVKVGIDKLFERIPKRHWVKLFFRLSDVLEQIGRDFRPKDAELKKAFDRIRFSVAAVTFRDSSVPLSHGISGKAPNAPTHGEAIRGVDEA